MKNNIAVLALLGAISSTEAISLQQYLYKRSHAKGKDWDGITHIVWEWVNGKMFPDKTTLWNNANGLTRTVSYACYWMDKYMKGEMGHKTGNNWEKVAARWKDEQVTTLNRVFAISQ